MWESIGLVFMFILGVLACTYSLFLWTLLLTYTTFRQEYALRSSGEVGEWFILPAWKVGAGVTWPEVRILSSLP